MSAPIGFLIWCPEHGLPRVVHGDFLTAIAEADRLKREHPDRRFTVMSPVEDMSGVGYALGWTRGREEGLGQAHREIMKAEASADRAMDQAHDLKAKVRRFEALDRQAKAFQSIVADALCWFDGYSGAFALRENYETPRTPDRERLRALNVALQEIAFTDAERCLDDEIPF